MTVSGTAGGFSFTDTMLTITDNDVAPTGITLSLHTISVAENSGTTTVTVTAAFSGTNPTSTLTSATEVTVSVLDNTATAGTDFTAVPAFTVTIGVGQSSGTNSFPLTVTNDTVVEGGETVTVGGAATGVPGSFSTITPATLTITDDDTGITLSLNRTSVDEEIFPGPRPDIPGPVNEETVGVTATFSGSSSTLTTGTVVVVTVAAGTASSVSPAPLAVPPPPGDYIAGATVMVTIPAEQGQRYGLLNSGSDRRYAGGSGRDRACYG